MDKKPLIILIVSTLLVGIVFLSLFITNFRPQRVGPSQPVETFLPEVIPSPKVYFDQQKSDQLLQIVKDRPTLERQDQEARQKLIDSLDNKSGILEKTTSYTIEYVKAPNVFQAEITTAEFLEAKKQAAAWFIDQGVSQAGLCKLPLMFYLSSEAKDKLKDQGIVFNPLPEGC